jgi:hypothetical protein
MGNSEKEWFDVTVLFEHVYSGLREVLKHLSQAAIPELCSKEQKQHIHSFASLLPPDSLSVCLK